MSAKQTRYAMGGTTADNQVGTGFWDRRNIQQQSDDLFVVINSVTARFPHLITKQVYNRDNLLWLLLQYNNIIDPVGELIVGKTVRLPQPYRIL